MYRHHVRLDCCDLCILRIRLQAQETDSRQDGQDRDDDDQFGECESIRVKGDGMLAGFHGKVWLVKIPSKY